MKAETFDIYLNKSLTINGNDRFIWEVIVQ